MASDAPKGPSASEGLQAPDCPPLSGEDKAPRMAQMNGVGSSCVKRMLQQWGENS